MTRRAWTQQLEAKLPALAPRALAVGRCAGRAMSRAIPVSATAAIAAPKPPPRPRGPATTLEGLIEELRTTQRLDDEIPAEQCFPVRAVPKPRQTQRDRWAKRPSVLAYRAMADELRLRGARLPHRYDVVFHLAMPESWPEAWKQAMEGKPHLRRPDVGNLAKALEDALVVRDERLHVGRFEKVWSREPAIVIRKLVD